MDRRAEWLDSGPEPRRRRGWVPSSTLDADQTEAPNDCVFCGIVGGDVPGSSCGHMFIVGQRISAALRRSDLQCEGVNFLVADGEAAMQEVFHVHRRWFVENSRMEAEGAREARVVRA